MLQLDILAGKKAGTRSAARHFPFRIGRAPGNELQMDDEGIWDQHLTLNSDRKKGIIVTTAPHALTAINSERVETAVLKNGDTITIGSAKVQVWLAAAPQRRLFFREAAVWMLWAAVTAGQCAILYWLVRYNP